MNAAFGETLVLGGAVQAVYDADLACAAPQAAPAVARSLVAMKNRDAAGQHLLDRSRRNATCTQVTESDQVLREIRELPALESSRDMQN